MTYRAPTFRERTGRATHGPFPIRKGRLLGAFGALFVAIMMTFFALDEETLVCDAAGWCGATHWGEIRTFPAASLESVRVDIETGSKNAKYGVVVLHLKNATELRLMRVTPEEAENAAREIRAAMPTRAPIAISLHNPRVFFAFAAGVVLLGIAIGWSAVKGLGRIRLELVQGGAALAVTRSVVGVPVSRDRAGLEGIVDVIVETGLLKDGWRSKGEAPMPTGRLVLVDRGGAQHPLTEKLFPGVGVHLRGAVALRALLGLEPRPGGVEEQLARLPLITTKLGMRIALAWPGLTVGSLLGIPVALVVQVAVGAFHRGDPVDGFVFGSGAIGGAITGVLVSLYLTRPRPQR